MTGYIDPFMAEAIEQKRREAQGQPCIDMEARIAALEKQVGEDWTPNALDEMHKSLVRLAERVSELEKEGG